MIGDSRPKLTIAVIAARRIFCRKMKTALFISPHLDDAAFSCGATLARLAAEKWQTILCTVFTKSVPRAEGFALACQLDKGLSAEIDYMKLRRAEDCRAAKILNASEVLHLNFAEAPHRGYESAAELFAGLKEADEMWRHVAEHLALLDDIHQPDLIFAPQGLGDHVDHRQTVRAVRGSLASEKICWYRDAPYAIRQPNASANDLPFDDLSEMPLDVSPYLERKIAACAAYASQIDFQFGGADKLKEVLRRFHQAEGARSGSSFHVAEVFLASAVNAAIFDKGKGAS
jgi:LmbE family N-acetylglucosaminyl deacetylase